MTRLVVLYALLAMSGSALAAASAPDPMFDRPVVIGVELHLPPGTPVPTDVRVDVRIGFPLSPREVRRSLVRLYGTGKFVSVVAYAVPAEGGVRLVFELTPKRFIKVVSITGTNALDRGTVLSAAGFGPKAEFTPELLRRAVDRIADAYRLRGYDNVETTVDVIDEGFDLSLVLRVTEGEPTTIDQITASGMLGLPLESILEAARIEVGGVLDRIQLAEGLERLRSKYRSEGYFRARVGDPVVSLRLPSASVALPISSGPKYEYHFHQNHHVPSYVLRSVLNYDGSETLDRPLMARLARRLQAYYAARGFRDAKVAPREVINPDRSRAVLAFDIEEGFRLDVSELVFDGNRDLPATELLEQVRAAVRQREPELLNLKLHDDPLQVEGRVRKQGTFEVPPPEPERVYSEEAYRDAAEAITNLYRARGFLSAKVRLEEAAIDLGRGTARVRFKIDEGPKTTVGKIGIDGMPEAVVMAAEAQILRQGAALNASLVERDRAQIAQRLAKEGYLFAKIEPDPRISEDGKAAAITYRVDPGPQVRIGQVSLQGVERSDPVMVRAHLRLSPGDVLSPERLAAAQRALASLGGYRQVAVRIDQPEVPEPIKDIRIEVTEKPFTEGEIGLGISAVDGPRLLIDGTLPNIFGQGINLEGRGKVHHLGIYQLLAESVGLPIGDPRELAYDHGATICDGSSRCLNLTKGLGWKGALSIRAPRIRNLFPANVGAHIDVVSESAFRSTAYGFTTVAGIVGADWFTTEWLTASLQYELEYAKVCPQERRDGFGTAAGNASTEGCQSAGTGTFLLQDDRRLFSFGRFLLHSVRPTIAIDLRDNPTSPTRGFVLTASGGLTSGFGPAHDAFLQDSDPLTPAEDPFPLWTLKTQANLTWYHSLAPRVVVAASIRGGRIVRLDDTSKTLATQRFYMGGFTTLRSFREDGVIAADRREDLRLERANCQALASPAGCTAAALALKRSALIASEGGEVFSLAKLELRFPFISALDLGVFFEAGNLWADIQNYEPFAVRPVVGGGVRYDTPIGPLALDVGFNLAPDPTVNEQQFNLHFNVGLF